MNQYPNLKSRIAMYTFTTTLIAGIASMAFSKKVKKPQSHTVSVKSIYDIDVKDINGDAINLGAFKGKKIMIVNVASSIVKPIAEYNLYDTHNDSLKLSATSIFKVPTSRKFPIHKKLSFLHASGGRSS